MFSSFNNGRAKLPTMGFALLFFTVSLIGPAKLPAQEQYPSVARLSFISGPVTYSRGDDPGEWDDAIENVPVSIGDRIYAAENGRAEIQLSSGNFIRLAPRSYLSTLNLSDDIKQFYLGEGSAAFTIRRLESDELIEIDTPNVSVTLDEPGRYRIAVDADGNSRIIVRSGRVTLAAKGRQIAVENGEVRVYGIDAPRYETVGLPIEEAFDHWVRERDDRFARVSAEAYRHASEDIVGVEDLAEYGRWENIPEYGYAWTPTQVVAGWMPFSDGRWYWQDPWGWTWISKQRWGWATSHYGRWTPYRSRWYWVPVRPRHRIKYAPACVEFVRVRDHVGWFPLHPRDRHVPWWERRDRRRLDGNVMYANRTYVTVINNNYFISGRPVNRQIVRDSIILHEARSARFAESLPIPNRSSLRLIPESGARSGRRPPETVINRTVVVRTAPPPPPRAFQEKLPEIQKNQGRAVDASRLVTAVDDDRARSLRTRIRAAADENQGDFAPRGPGETSGAAPQPLTPARGKRLATRDNPVRNNLTEQRASGTTAPQPSTGATATKPEISKTEQDAEGRRQSERDRRAEQEELDRRKQEQQREIERKRQAQQQEQQRKAQERNDQRRDELKQQAAPSREQQRLEELERRQAQEEAERKRQALQRQEQQRQQQLRQQQLQERQTQQQRQQELERRKQLQPEQEQERKAPAQQQQQDQLKQQQLQEGQAREQQRQELQRRQPQPQEREPQQAQRQQEQERRQQQFRQPQVPERQIQQQPQQPRQPGQL